MIETYKIYNSLLQLLIMRGKIV